MVLGVIGLVVVAPPDERRGGVSQPVTYFQSVRLYSAVEVCIFTALLVVAIGGFGESAETILGWTHGFGWIILCLLVANGRAGRSSRGPCSRPPSRRSGRWEAPPGSSTWRGAARGRVAAG